MFCVLVGVCMYLWCAALKDAVVRFGDLDVVWCCWNSPSSPNPGVRDVALTVHHLDNAAAPIRSWWPREAVCWAAHPEESHAIDVGCLKTDKRTVRHYTIYIMWHLAVDAVGASEKVWIATVLQTHAAFSRKVDAFEAKTAVWAAQIIHILVPLIARWMGTEKPLHYVHLVQWTPWFALCRCEVTSIRTRKMA